MYRRKVLTRVATSLASEMKHTVNATPSSVTGPPHQPRDLHHSANEASAFSHPTPHCTHAHRGARTDGVAGGNRGRLPAAALTKQTPHFWVSATAHIPISSPTTSTTADTRGATLRTPRSSPLPRAPLPSPPGQQSRPLQPSSGLFAPPPSSSESVCSLRKRGGHASSTLPDPRDAAHVKPPSLANETRDARCLADAGNARSQQLPQQRREEVPTHSTFSRSPPSSLLAFTLETNDGNGVTENHSWRCHTDRWRGRSTPQGWPRRQHSGRNRSQHHHQHHFRQQQQCQHQQQERAYGRQRRLHAPPETEVVADVTVDPSNLMAEMARIFPPWPSATPKATSGAAAKGTVRAPEDNNAEYRVSSWEWEGDGVIGFDWDRLFLVRTAHADVDPISPDDALTSALSCRPVPGGEYDDHRRGNAPHDPLSTDGGASISDLNTSAAVPMEGFYNSRRHFASDATAGVMSGADVGCVTPTMLPFTHVNAPAKSTNHGAAEAMEAMKNAKSHLASVKHTIMTTAKIAAPPTADRHREHTLSPSAAFTSFTRAHRGKKRAYAQAVEMLLHLSSTEQTTTTVPYVSSFLDSFSQESATDGESALWTTPAVYALFYLHKRRIRRAATCADTRVSGKQGRSDDAAHAPFQLSAGEHAPTQRGAYADAIFRRIQRVLPNAARTGDVGTPLKTFFAPIGLLCAIPGLPQPPVNTSGISTVGMAAAMCAAAGGPGETHPESMLRPSTRVRASGTVLSLHAYFSFLHPAYGRPPGCAVPESGTEQQQQHPHQQRVSCSDHVNSCFGENRGMHWVAREISLAQQTGVGCLRTFTSSPQREQGWDAANAPPTFLFGQPMTSVAGREHEHQHYQPHQLRSRTECRRWLTPPPATLEEKQRDRSSSGATFTANATLTATAFNAGYSSGHDDGVRNQSPIHSWRCVPLSAHAQQVFSRSESTTENQTSIATRSDDTDHAATTTTTASTDLPCAQDVPPSWVSSRAVGALLLLREEWTYFSILMHAHCPWLIPATTTATTCVRRGGRGGIDADVLSSSSLKTPTRANETSFEEETAVRLTSAETNGPMSIGNVADTRADYMASHCLSYAKEPICWLLEDRAALAGKGSSVLQSAQPTVTATTGVTKGKAEAPLSFVSTLPRTLLVLEEPEFDLTKDDVFANYLGLGSGNTRSSSATDGSASDDCSARGGATGETSWEAKVTPVREQHNASSLSPPPGAGDIYGSGAVSQASISDDAVNDACKTAQQDVLDFGEKRMPTAAMAAVRSRREAALVQKCATQCLLRAHLTDCQFLPRRRINPVLTSSLAVHGLPRYTQRVETVEEKPSVKKSAIQGMTGGDDDDDNESGRQQRRGKGVRGRSSSKERAMGRAVKTQPPPSVSKSTGDRKWLTPSCTERGELHSPQPPSAPSATVAPSGKHHEETTHQQDVQVEKTVTHHPPSVSELLTFSVFPSTRCLLKNPSWRRKPVTLAMEMRFGRIIRTRELFVSFPRSTSANRSPSSSMPSTTSVSSQPSFSASYGTPPCP